MSLAFLLLMAGVGALIGHHIAGGRWGSTAWYGAAIGLVVGMALPFILGLLVGAVMAALHLLVLLAVIVLVLLAVAAVWRALH